LNFCRTSATAFTFANNVYVFGGYSGKGIKPIEVEVFKDNSWNIINYKIPFGIESASYI